MIAVCASCNREIAPGEVGARFKCPGCGEHDLWRCTKCRRLSNPYRCTKCGFTGP